MSEDQSGGDVEIERTLPKQLSGPFDATRRLMTRPDSQEGLEVIEEAATLAESDPAETKSSERVPSQLSAESSITMSAPLDSGGLAKIYLASQDPFGREVAVKFLRAERNDPENRRLIRGEGVLTGYLDHPNVVPVYRLTDSDDRGTAIVMKCIRGRSLQELRLGDYAEVDFVDEQDPLTGLLRILIDVCHAVEFAHSRGVIHRDLKPHNVMIGDFGDVYLIDWGLGVYLGEEEPPEGVPRPSDNGSPVGTPAYMAPEMVGGRADDLSFRTDQFLLGGLLHFLVTGEPPYEGSSIEAVLLAAHQCEMQSYGDGPSAELAAIVRRAMARDPAERYPSVSDFRRALLDFLSHESSRELSAKARRKLDEIEGLVDEEADSLSNGVILRHLGEARFGFRAALDSWSGNEQAREGLQRLLELGVEWGLTEGAPETAMIFLNELPEQRPELRKRVEQVNQWFSDRQTEGLFFEQAPTALAVVDADGSMSYVNKRLCRMFGYTVSELVGKPVELLIPERFRAHHGEYRQTFMANPSERPMGTDLELCGRAKEGGEFPIDIELTPVQTDGEPLVLASIVQLEEEHSDGEGGLSVTARSVLRHLPQAVFVEAEGEIRFANSRAVEWLDYASVESLLGQPFEAVVRLDEADDDSPSGELIDAHGGRKPARLTVDSVEMEMAEGSIRPVRLVTAEPV